jgi:hypothetical protein
VNPLNKATVILAFTATACLSTTAYSQVADSINVARARIIGNDTVPLIELPEVRVYERSDYEYLYLKRKYQKLIRNVKVAYPYARIAAGELEALDRQLAGIKKEKDRKEFIDQAEKAIMDRFEKEIRGLTITQGIILVKLIDRETGRTSFEVIKDLKGGFTAFFWQGISRIFGNNLKAEYDPDGDDRVIEDIVRCIEAGFI